ncbi:hypothetical protein SAMN00017405_0380 [Desulfonispora thiosulfatigenes DSM 11270]|uniref:Uncharacterized protein n=1 Tax=Desulfonispora thiosulfatigenes DSM 11270 TaxID=656914 RepID=A0A1W1VPR5_DESTI|nr:Gp138 family membrane-puncturing spike protein [Desulfonispora thiosulfatigenes]SMB95326.1 hypothetical protein SAMN00017405_0380 [Desulfonispora thiosulfatigenes DSM 11270]
MSRAINFLEGLVNSKINNLHTCMPCKIEKFNEAQGTADVVPLFIDLPMLINIPILKQKTKENSIISVSHPFYEKGDTVLVVFAERALDGSGERKHDLSDGIILGLLS